MNFESIIQLSLQEDLGALGDITSDAIFTNEESSYQIIAKDSGILCGIEVCSRVFKKVDSGLNITLVLQDGKEITKGDVILKVEGKTNSILKAERTALNFLSHLSGVATKSKEFSKKSGNIILLDTRKTIPGLRDLQKYAVRTGGCQNHRIGLYDMVMIKDNHIDAAGGIIEAVNRVRQMWGSRFKIEVETRTLDEVNQAIIAKADRIMLDNMDNVLMKECIALINGRAEVEASGNMTLERLQELQGIGINFVSFGELTNTVNVFDFSMVQVGSYEKKL